jgi:hypothetical protein
MTVEPATDIGSIEHQKGDQTHVKFLEAFDRLITLKLVGPGNLRQFDSADDDRAELAAVTEKSLRDDERLLSVLRRRLFTPFSIK